MKFEMLLQPVICYTGIKLALYSEASGIQITQELT